MALFQAEIFIGQPTQIEYREGLFFVTDVFRDGMEIRRVYSPHTYLASMRAAQEAMAAWAAEQREVIPLALARRTG